MKNVNFILGFALLSMVAISCKKEEGCTDKSASNFSETAEKDDGSCKYKGSVVFWYDALTALLMSAEGIESLTFYVDGAIVGSTAASVYWDSAPSCGANGTITVEKDLGASKSKSFTYSIVDNFDDEIWGGTSSFEANTCKKLVLNP